MWQILTSFWLVVTYTPWVAVSTCTLQRVCKHAFTVTMTASGWDSMSGLITSAQKSFQSFLFMAQALLFGIFHSPLCVFSGWKDTVCPHSASRAETHKRCWPLGARLGFPLPSLGSTLLWTQDADEEMLHKSDSKNTPYSRKPTHTDLVGGTGVSLEGHCDFVLWFLQVQWTSITAQQSEVSCYALVLCHIIVVFNAPSLLYTEPLQLHLHSLFTLEIAEIIGDWLIKESSIKAKQKSKV